MREEGWGYATIASSHEHYFVNGKSLCENFLLLGHKVFETTSNPCPDCLKTLTQNEDDLEDQESKE